MKAVECHGRYHCSGLDRFIKLTLSNSVNVGQREDRRAPNFFRLGEVGAGTHVLCLTHWLETQLYLEARDIRVTPGLLSPPLTGSDMQVLGWPRASRLGQPTPDRAWPMHQEAAMIEVVCNVLQRRWPSLHTRV